MKNTKTIVAVMFVISFCGCSTQTPSATPDSGQTEVGPEAGTESDTIGVAKDGALDSDLQVSSSTFESPIQLVFKIHIEPQAELAAYKLRRDSVDAVRKLADKYGAKLSIHGNGEFWQYAAEENDAPLLNIWLQGGHDIGLHMHGVYEDPDGSHQWTKAKPNQTGETFMRSLWDDHERYLKAVLPSLKIDQATPYNSLDANFVDLMKDYGYLITGGGRHEIAVAWFGHQPFHPFRIGAKYLEEDLSSPVLMVHHQPQITEADLHGPPGGITFEDQSLPHLKVQFLQLYLNRMYAERMGQADDRIWMFGILTHDNKSNGAMQAQIDLFLQWLADEFGKGRKSHRGNTVLQWASFSEVRDAYVKWESEHPGVSSFNYPTPTFLSPNDATKISDAESKKNYPHPFWGMAQLLHADENRVVEYVTKDERFLDVGVECHALQTGNRSESKRASLWLCYKETDGSATIDVSQLVGGDSVRLWNVADKSSTVTSAVALKIASVPVLFDLPSSPTP